MQFPSTLAFYGLDYRGKAIRRLEGTAYWLSGVFTSLDEYSSRLFNIPDREYAVPPGLIH